ncbi:MAG: fluoride efflux transporter CrcB [Streptosporangiaceae bacterium]
MRGSRAGQAPGRPARPPHRLRPPVVDLAAVGAGGALGSTARYLVELAVPTVPGFPWPTFTVNVVGSFVLGLLMVYLLDVWPPRRELRLFLTTGIIGGFTTFSSFATEVALQLHAGGIALADAYALSSLVAGVAAVWAGVMTARFATRQRAASAGDDYPDDRSAGDLAADSATGLSQEAASG